MIILPVSLDDSLKVYNQIPEFSRMDSIDFMLDRIGDSNCINLVAYCWGVPVGFKLGYELDSKIFYSWLGGVLPGFRRKGGAKLLAEEFESLLRLAEYDTLRMKTKNKFVNMRMFAAKIGFQVYDFKPAEDPFESKTYLEKKLY